MISAFNHHFSEKTKILKACTKITGFGEKMAQQALDRIGITTEIEIAKLSASQLSQIKLIIEQSYDIDNELRILTTQNIGRLASISCYRGLRHNIGLPCRGQRTHSNARTCRRLRVKRKSI